jgi:glycosyl transferase family 2
VALRRLAGETDGFRNRRISAMVRVRDEEEYLLPAVRSIAAIVDEIVLVDNGSIDASPAIIEALRRENPDKVSVFQYPPAIAKVGAETWKLAEQGPTSSPRLSATYYNWCLQRCSHPYVLKWDGDMVALPRLAKTIGSWRRCGRQVVEFLGANVHPDLEHLLAARITDRNQLLGSLAVPALPLWATSLTYDFPEPRLFPKAFARYSSRLKWTQELSSPFLRPPLRDWAAERMEGPLYLHLKFAKRRPLDGYSPDLRDAIAANVTRGPRLSPEHHEALAQWGIARDLGEREGAVP